MPTLARLSPTAPRTLAITSTALGLVIVLAAPSALAAPLYTVTAGTKISGTTTWTGASGPVTVKDLTTSQFYGCKSSMLKGTAALGTGKTGINLGTVTGKTEKNCVGPLGLVLVATQVGTWPIDFTGPTSAAGVTKGRIRKITVNDVSKTAGACDFTITGSIDLTYNNTTHVLAIATSTATANKLVVSKVVGCFGLVNNGDIISYRANFTITTPTGPLKIKGA